MIGSDTVSLAFRNLRESKLRTALTSLGVSIGIASLVGMVSFGVALQDQVVGAFLRSGVFDSITVTTGALPQIARPRGAGRGGRVQGRGQAARVPAERPALDDEALKALAGLEHVKEVYPEVRVPVELKYGEVSEFTVARGVPMSAKGEGAFQDISAGEFFPSESEDVCLIGADLARRLAEGEPSALLGKSLTLGFASAQQIAQLAVTGGIGGLNLQRNERPFRIVGIVTRQSGAAGPLAALFAPLMIPLPKAIAMGGADLSNPQALLRQLSAKRTYATVTVKVRRAQDTEAVEKKIRDLGFNAFSVADLLQNQKRAFILLDLILGLVGSIALTVASLGIVNTMVMSILERTREIGIMKAIGADDQDVRRIFLIEAGIIGLAGGLFGVALGWGVGRVINIGANYYLQTQGAPAANLFLIPWWLVAGAITFAVLVGIVAGGFPASRAARLDPIQALRHD